MTAIARATRAVVSPVLFHHADRPEASDESRGSGRSASQATREAALFRTTFQQAPDGMAHVAFTGRWLRVNDRLLEIVGYSRDELLRKTVQEITHPEDLAEDLRLLRQLIEGEIARYSLDKRYFRGDGAIVWVNVSVALAREHGGRADCLLMVVQEITERKLQEERLRQSAAELNALNQRLRRAMAETHHRVKNNLHVIAALAEMQAIEREASVSASAVQQLAQHTRAIAAVHDLLSRQAHEGGDTEGVPAGAVAEQLVALLRPSVGGRSLQATIEDFVLPARQATALVVILNELVSNAVKHGDGAIEVILTVDDGSARLRVCDEGPGFAADFDPDVHGNMGVELVRNLGTWDLGGSVSFDNPPEGGACVTVVFPRASA